jgi:hypothetical protein
LADCEWCGRPGKEIQLHVRDPERAIEFATPTLCEVCSGLVGFFSDPDLPRPSEPGFLAYAERRAAEAQDGARTKLFVFLSENYRRRGSPIAAFMAEPYGLALIAPSRPPAARAR